MKRRELLKAMAASAVVWHSPVFSQQTAQNRKNCVWIILRGAMDGLSAVTPTFDHNLTALRPGLLLPSEDMLSLNSQYTLHPALKNFHSLYLTGELLPVVATSSGYNSRSHFDGQDWLESGLNHIDHDSGWLARISNMASKESLAIARSVPISLREDIRYPTWYPSRFPDVEEDFYLQLAELYSEDAMLSSSVSELMDTRKALGKNSQGTSFRQLASTYGNILSQENGPDCAMLELGGWDTHNNQLNRLNQKFTELDQGIAALQQSLQQHWHNTVVIIATEFGRTVRQNGTQGTDHGTASTLFLAGGAINGGQVLGQWPGTSDSQLFEGRDLQPTSNSFDWIGTLLAQHWQISESKVKQALPTYQHQNHQLVNQ